MNALNFAIAALTLWRVSALLSYERGPRDVFLRLRERAGIEHDDDGEPISWPETWLAGVLSCVWCLSVNLSVPLALLWLLWPDGAFWLCLPLALSGAAVVIERWTHG